MKKLKIKVKENNNEIEFVYLDGKKQIGLDKKYINECIVCKTRTIDCSSFGEKYICSDCMKTIKQTINLEQNIKVKNTSIYSNVKHFNTSIKIINYVEYLNVMTRRVNEKTATIIIELILQGYNTATKIAEMIKSDNVATIYYYLLSMAKAGMIYSNKARKDLYNRIFKITPSLTYTRV